MQLYFQFISSFSTTGPRDETKSSSLCSFYGKPPQRQARVPILNEAGTATDADMGTGAESPNSACHFLLVIWSLWSDISATLNTSMANLGSLMSCVGGWAQRTFPPSVSTLALTPRLWPTQRCSATMTNCQASSAGRGKWIRKWIIKLKEIGEEILRGEKEKKAWLTRNWELSWLAGIQKGKPKVRSGEGRGSLTAASPQRCPCPAQTSWAQDAAARTYPGNPLNWTPKDVRRCQK